MKRTLRLLRGLLAVLLVFYAVGLLALFGLWRTDALAIWWVQLLNLFGLWLYLPLPFALLLALLARPRKVALVLLLPLLAFGWEYGAQFAPHRPSTTGTPLRMMTWNIYVRNLDIDGILTTVRAQQPDVVALQELGNYQADSLDRSLQRDYPYRVLAPGGSGGLGVWSRYPLMQVAPPEGRTSGCSCQRLMLDINGQRVRLVNAHPMVPEYRWGFRYVLKGARPIRYPRYFSTQRQEPALAELVAEASAGGQPLIMVGDFNTGDRQPNYWRLRQYLGDSFREAGWGFGLTYPNAGKGYGRGLLPPMIRIDYIFHSPGIVARSAHTVAGAGSDHRGVVADLSLDEPGSAFHPLFAFPIW
jgi:endonuclease/exonuclease/phosphatase (EEP) superfamily protein YafD